MTSGGNFAVKAFHGDIVSGYLQSTRLRFRNVCVHSPVDRGRRAHHRKEVSWVGLTDWHVGGHATIAVLCGKKLFFKKTLELQIGVPIGAWDQCIYLSTGSSEHITQTFGGRSGSMKYPKRCESDFSN